MGSSPSEGESPSKHEDDLTAIIQRLLGAVASLAFSPDGKILASGGDDSTVKLWSLITGGERGRLVGAHAGAVDRLVFSPDTGLMISSGGFSSPGIGGELHVWRGRPRVGQATRP